MTNLGFTVNAVEQVLARLEHIAIYQSTLGLHLDNLKQSEMRSFESYFRDNILFALGQDQNVHFRRREIREKIRKWMYMSIMKFDLLLALPEMISIFEGRHQASLQKYAGIPLGPIEEDVVNSMDASNRAQLRDANVTISHFSATIHGLLITWVSSSFLSLEYICRAICYCTCYQFLLASLQKPSVVQHQQVYKTLRRLAAKEKRSEACVNCPIISKCQLHILDPIIGLYEVFYHLRVICDYKGLIFSNPNIQTFIRNEFVPKSLEALILADQSMEVFSAGYLRSPLSFKERSELFPSLKSNVLSLVS